MLDGYTEDRFDRLMIFYTRFVNTMKQEPVMEQLLPLSGEKLGAPEGSWDYIYEPDAKDVLDQVLTRYIEALIYQSITENIASEQIGAHGGDEGRIGQRGQRHRRADADLQQDAPGLDHQGIVGDRGRRGGSMTRRLERSGDTHMCFAHVMGRPDRPGAAAV